MRVGDAAPFPNGFIITNRVSSQGLYDFALWPAQAAPDAWADQTPHFFKASLPPPLLPFSNVVHIGVTADDVSLPILPSGRVLNHVSSDRRTETKEKA